MRHDRPCLIGRLLLYGALLVSIAVVVVAACTPPATSRPSPSPSRTPAPTARPTTAAPTPTRTPTLTPTPPPTTAPTATATASPGGTPAAACSARTGGAAGNTAILTAVRAAHHPGYDRLVFEFGPEAFGTYGMPQFRVEVATSFVAPSGQAVRVDGNALFGVRFQGAAAHTATGVPTVGTAPLRPGLPLIREVRIVEDFEGVVVEGVGLERLACPTILVLASPVRLVLDFPTPP